MADLSGLAEIARDLGPVVAIALFLTWSQNRTASRLLDAVLDEVRALRSSSADVAAEVRGLRADLVRAETRVDQVASGAASQGTALAVLDVRLCDIGRRVDALEARSCECQPSAKSECQEVPTRGTRTDK